MKARDKHLAELMHWVLVDVRRQNIPTITEHAVKRYKITERTARKYAITIMQKLGLLSQSMKVSDLYMELQREKDRSSPLHYPRRKSLKIGDEDFYKTEFVKASEF